MVIEKILTSNEKKHTLKLTIREFRNNFSKDWPLVSNDTSIIVYHRDKPILRVSSYKK